jgi:hypothetical protein
MPAVGAQSVKLQLVPGEHRAQFAGDILLYPLDCVVFEFHDLAALFTDKMVMMMLAGDFKSRLVFIEMTLCEQLALLEQFESPVNRRITDVGVYFLYFDIKFLSTDMAAELEENPGDIIPWRGGLEATVVQTRME